LGRHVPALAASLAAAGHEMTDRPGAPLEEAREGVRVVRAPEDPQSPTAAGPGRLARSARHMVRTRFGWAGIADRTAATYRATIAGGGPHLQRQIPRPSPAMATDRNLLVDTATGCAP